RWITIAEGRKPVHARSAEITYHFDPHRGKPYIELDFGRIDLRELKFIENRHTGDLLAELVPPVEPQDGKTVTGAVVAAETGVQPVQLRAGAGTELNAKATAVYAAADGNVRLRDGLIVVEQVVTVENVGYETGHIHHDGSVVVQKHVADGFVVEATGDIEVGAGVGKATLRAGGNILLKTGISGNGEGSIECDGNVFAKYVESATVQCGGHLLVQEGILHSRVSTWGHCVLNGRRSEIIASNMIVGGSVWCKQIGSVAEGPVYVSVGIPPRVLVSFRDTKRALEEAQNELEGVQLQLRQIEHSIAQGRAGEKLMQARAQLEDTAGDLGAKIKSLRGDMHELRDRLTVTRGAMLVAEESMYRGVVVAFGTREFRVPDGGARATVLSRHGSNIEEHGYNPADPPRLEFEA
ncbi:MAG: FapA family protein, partial [Spirochaetaceae bacterium]